MQDESDTTSSPPSVSRRSILEYASASAAMDRIRRMMPAREKAMDSMKTLFWVIPLTLIIWVYAEQEQVLQTPATVSNVPVPITTTGDRYAAAVSGVEPTVTLKLTGPQEAVARVKEHLYDIPPRVVIAIDASRPDGNNQPINVVDAIQDEDIFRKNGVTVKESVPAEINVNIDKMAHLMVPVELPPDVSNLSGGAFDPPKVNVSGPRTVLDHLIAAHLLKVYANLDGLDELKHPGEHKNLSVPVSLSPPQAELGLNPPQIKATVTRLQEDVQEVIGPIPIVVMMPPGMVGQYQLTPTAGWSIDQIHVSGPQQDIDALKNYSPKAILEILPSDATLDTPNKHVRFDLPPNIKVSDADAALTVEFKMTKRD